MSKKRIAWVDVAKGIAMVLVVWGHNPLPTLGVQLLYGLNVPIFFLMSGYTFRTEKYESFFSLIKTLARRILIPYVVMNILAFFVYHWARDLSVTKESVWQLFSGTLYGEGIRGALKFNQPLWFLPCIFVVQALWYLTDRYAKKARWFLVFAFSLIGYFISSWLSIRLPWGMDVAFSGLVFFALGQFFCRKRVDETLFRVPVVLGFLLMLIANIGFNILNQQSMPFPEMNVDMNAMVFGNYFLFYLSAISGCICIIYLAKLLSHSRILAHIGRNTLWILGLHSLFIQLFELKLKLSILPSVTANSLLLCFLEIGGVLVVKLIYDKAKKRLTEKKEKQHEAG